jgi:sigma-B regulation protein RsbU (phosphoserine phosphatase)
MKALIADDERVAREILSRAMYQWGFDVIVASDGAEALAGLRAADGPIIAVLDWMMPHIEGPDVCRQIRSDRPGANMYLMLLTSLEGRLDVVTGLEAGADDYIVKPFHADELHARVNVGVRLIALQERLNARVADLQVALANVKTLQGLLPICSYCKRIRRDDHNWQRVESYIAERSEAQFSHAICPECYMHVEQEIEERLKEKRPS